MFRFFSLTRVNLFLLLWAVCTSIPALASSANIEAFPSSTDVLEDENVSIEFKVAVDAISASIGKPSYQAPDFDEVNSYSGSTGVESVFANGTLSVRRTEAVTVVLHPRKTGQLRISNIKVVINGKAVLARDVEINVHPRGSRLAKRGGGSSTVNVPRSQLPNTGVQPSRSYSNSFFLKTEPSKLKAYKGEQIILTYALYTRVPILQIYAERYPTVPGFLKEDIDIPMLNMRMNYSSSVVNGMEFHRAPLAQYAIYPVKEGPLTIDPLTAKFSYRSQARPNNFNNDDDDPFGIVNQFFRAMQASTESRSSDRVQIEVLPLPAAGQPAGFSGLVGDFNITAVVDKYSLKAGESLNVTVKIDGKGHAGSLEQLKVDWPTDFELYEDKSTTTTTKTGYSERIFNFMLIPKTRGKYQIPSIEIAMFNPDTKSYLTRRSQPLAIEVLEGDGGNVFVGTQDKKKAVPEVKTDIRYWATSFPQQESSLLNKIFRAIALLSFGSVGVGFIAIGRVGRAPKKQDKHSEIKEVIDKADRLSKAQLKPEQALFEAETLLAKAIHLVFSATLGSMTRADLRAHLQDQGVEENRIAQFENLLERCENLRFMPGGSTQAEAQRLLQEISQVLRGIQNSKA